MNKVESSYLACRQIVRASGSNFPWTFYVLPRPKRRAMEALYAFARLTDDIADGDEPVDIKRERLQSWRSKLTEALAGDCDHETLSALSDSAQRFEIPSQYLHAIIDGVERDLRPVEFASFDELAAYCELVASAVGIACIHIWGFTSLDFHAPARDCGVAFQLTNILRDLREDTARSRYYLPAEDLQRFAVDPIDLSDCHQQSHLEALIQFQLARTEALYQSGAATIDYLSSDGKRIFPLLFGTYHALFRELQERGVAILQSRVRLPFAKKLLVAARALVGARLIL